MTKKRRAVSDNLGMNHAETVVPRLRDSRTACRHAFTHTHMESAVV